MQRIAIAYSLPLMSPFRRDVRLFIGSHSNVVNSFTLHLSFEPIVQKKS